MSNLRLLVTTMAVLFLCLGFGDLGQGAEGAAPGLALSPSITAFWS